MRTVTISAVSYMATSTRRRGRGVTDLTSDAGATAAQAQTQSILTKLEAHSKREAVGTAVRERIIAYPSAA